jgi:hypothetical protein
MVFILVLLAIELNFSDFDHFFKKKVVLTFYNIKLIFLSLP